jgi:hypothetical protein
MTVDRPIPSRVVALLAAAVLAVVAALTLTASPAVAEVGPAAQTRVAASDPALGAGVGAEGSVLAGERRGTTTSQPGTVVGSCVAPQTGGGWLYRSMKAAADGFPEVGATARTVGVRPGTDISVDSAGMVHSGTGGMSVTPDDPVGLPDHRRPPECGGGTGRDPVFRILRSALGSDLTYRPDPANPTGHGFVEPAKSMSIDDYQGALAATRTRWELVVF